jgi:hypothetical protein
MMKKITEVAKVIRSKNSSPFELTLDIIVKTPEYYYMLKNKNAVTRELIAKIYRINLDDVGKLVWFDPANAIKIGIKRRVSSGSPGDSDVYGAQQHAPLLTLEFDI